MFVLNTGYPGSVHVFDTTAGKRTAKWDTEYPIRNPAGKILAIVNKELIIMNKKEASIYRYTKSGELLGSIECAHVCGDKRVICQADSESIILANVRKAFNHQPDERRDNFVITCVDSPVYTAAGLKGLYNKAKANFSSKEAPYAEIIKLNLKSGYVEWTSAITKLTDERVLVAGWKQGLRQTNLFIMNTSSGKQMPLRLVWTIIFLFKKTPTKCKLIQFRTTV